MADKNKVSFYLEFKSKGEQLLKKYKNNINDLATSAKQTASATDKSAKSMDNLGTSSSKVSKVMNGLTNSIKNTKKVSDFSEAAESSKLFSNNINSLNDEMQGLDTESKKAAQSLDNLRKAEEKAANEYKDIVDQRQKLRDIKTGDDYKKFIEQDKILAQEEKNLLKTSKDLTRQREKAEKSMNVAAEKAKAKALKDQTAETKKTTKATTDLDNAQKKASNNRYSNSVKKNTKELKENKEEATDLGGALGKVTDLTGKGLALAGITLSVGAFVAYGKAIVDNNAELEILSKRSGVAVSDLQAINDVAKGLNLNIQQVTDKYYDLNEKIQEAAAYGTGEAIDPLKALNLSAEELKKLSPDKQLNEIFKAMQGFDKLSQKQIFAQLNIDDIENLARAYQKVADRRKDLEDRGLLLKDGAVFLQTKEDLNLLLQDIEAFGSTVLKDLIPIIKQLTLDENGNSLLNGENAKKLAIGLGKTALVLKVLFDICSLAVGQLGILSEKLTLTGLLFSNDLSAAIQTATVYMNAFIDVVKKGGAEEGIKQVADKVVESTSVINKKLRTIGVTYGLLAKAKGFDGLGDSLLSMAKNADEEVKANEKVQKAIGAKNILEQDGVQKKIDDIERLRRANNASYRDTNKQNQAERNKQANIQLAALEVDLGKLSDDNYLPKIIEKATEKAKVAAGKAGEETGKKYITELQKQLVVKGLEDEIKNINLNFELENIDQTQATNSLTKYYDQYIVYLKTIGKTDIEINTVRKAKEEDLLKIKNFVSKTEQERIALLQLQIKLLADQGNEQAANSLQQEQDLKELGKSYENFANEVKARKLYQDIIDVQKVKENIDDLNKELTNIDVKVSLGLDKEKAKADIQEVYRNLRNETAKQYDSENKLLALQEQEQQALLSLAQKKTLAEQQTNTVLGLQLELLRSQGKEAEAIELSRASRIDEIKSQFVDLEKQAEAVDLTNKLIDREVAQANLNKISEDITKLEKQLNNSDFLDTSNRVNLEGQINTKLQERIEIQKQLGIYEEEYNKTYMFSVENVIKLNGELKDSFKDIFSEFASGALSGKEAIGQFAAFFVKKLSEMALEQLYLNSISAFTGASTSNVANNKVGLGSLFLSAFSGAPKYHTGGTIGETKPMMQLPGVTKSNESIAILEQGEKVLTKQQQKQSSNANTTVNNSGIRDINVNLDGDDFMKKNLGSDASITTLTKIMRQNSAKFNSALGRKS